MAFKKLLKESKLDNLDFLNLDTKEKCYLMGLFMADGYVQQNGLWIYLVEEDLTNLRPLLENEMPFSFYTRQLSNRRLQMAAYMHSRHLAEALDSKFNFSEKSKIFFPIKIDPALMRYYLRGYFDGDGCFFFKCYNYEGKSKNCPCSFNVSAPYDFNWGGLENILSDLGIEYRIARYNYVEKNSKFSRLVISKEAELLKLIDYIYDTEYDGIGLERKFNKAQEIKLYKKEIHERKETNRFVA